MAKGYGGKPNLKMSSGNRRPPVKRIQKRRRVPAPLMLIAVIAVVVLVILFVAKFIRENEAKEPAKTDETSAISDVSEINNENGDTSEDKAPHDNENYDDLTPAKEKDISGAQTEFLNTMFIVGNSGYRYYKFNETQGINYIETINAGASKLSSRNVYQIIVPTATDIMLSQSFLSEVETSDQEKAIDYFNSSINSVAPSVKTIDLYDILKANCDKDIYFRTDRNWTQLGAYYAYRAFAMEKGITALPLTDYTQKEFTGFSGSIYSQSDYRTALETPESVMTYSPPGNISVTNINSSSESSEASLIADVSESDASDKYNAFLGGNYPYSLITNHDFEGEESCLLIKDSMGNAFAPFLSSHYKHVYIVDYRSWSGSASSLAEEKNINDIIIMNQIELTSDYDLLPDLQSVF